MELNHDFTVSVDIDQAWAALTDLERIAPCMPGAQLTQVQGDEYRGTVKVKVGPITAQYRGTARLLEADRSTHTAVLRAEGRDTRGQGAASATVTATLHESGPATQVRISTDLDISGKVAQFGRGVLGDVSEKILAQFVAALEEDLARGAKTTESGPGGGRPADEGDPQRASNPEVEPVDLLAAARGSVLKRSWPIALGLAVLLIIRRLRRR
ncbi:MAG: SRPBCC family protein [Acidimicrobiales bacterium]